MSQLTPKRHCREVAGESIARQVMDNSALTILFSLSFLYVSCFFDLLEVLFNVCILYYVLFLITLES